MPPDAPPVDAPVDARPDLVIGTVSLGYRTETGVEERYTDLTAVAIAALVPDDAEPSGFRTIVGAGTADGRFAIEGVPPEMPYYLKVGNRYYWTHLHWVQLRSVVPTRPDVRRATQPTPVAVDVPPCAGGRALCPLSVVSVRAGVLFEPTYRADGSPVAEGDWADANFYYDGTTNGGLPEGAAGDDLRFVMYRRESRTGGEAIVAHRVATFEPPSIVAGRAQMLVGSAAEIRDELPVRLIMGNRAAFDSLFDGRSGFVEASLSVHAPLTFGARWLSIGGFVYGPVVGKLSTRERSPTGALPALDERIRDPFGGVGVRTAVLEYRRRWWYAAPGAAAPFGIDGGLVRVADRLDFPFPSSSMIAPPSALFVDGHPASSGGSLGPGPVALTWTASARARQYQVSVFRLLAAGPRFTGAVTTSDVRATVPSELLTGSEYFAFAVSAFAGANDLSAGELYPDGVPADQATTLTGAFRLLATCGDGDVDLGEDCDSRGLSTSTCDGDCTAPRCGDGMLNALAGELCDAVVDTMSCDADCTAPVCGDGHLNLELEQCDDGNAVDDGNGCSAACRFNRCGDGVVQAYGEQCDTAGASATCDADCTVVECGDRVINAAAGETCDDGAPDDGDGCSSTCRHE
ncbi:MAG: hypothetical protein KBG48_24415 [Kofleriaceae bacterium]|nr:hypothetical protein [Kofleriaceae bacterium]MBP9170569.1 hypothetical protein [Kofleriaceae bacterium]MBP9861157.1 hypothetical protein [Kofleriaceae bacterium]